MYKLHIYGVRIRFTLRLTISQSVLVLSPSGTNDQILVVVKTDVVLFAIGTLPVEMMGLLYNGSQFSMSSNMYKFTF
jgi:hypothetical protein